MPLDEFQEYIRLLIEHNEKERKQNEKIKEGSQKSDPSIIGRSL
jgi:hypothetical protein